MLEKTSIQKEVPQCLPFGQCGDNKPQYSMCVEGAAVAAEMETEDAESRKTGENGENEEEEVVMMAEEEKEEEVMEEEKEEKEEEKFVFKFREESVFLRRAYNYAKLPPRFLVTAMELAVEGLSPCDRVRALGEMALVAREWHQAARSVALMAPAVTDALASCAVEVCNMQVDVHRSLAALQAEKGANSSSSSAVGMGDDAERLRMLDETLERVKAYVSAQVTGRYWRCVRHPLLTYVLLRGLHKELRTAAEAVARYVAERSLLGGSSSGNRSGNRSDMSSRCGHGFAGSFDIVEMSVRRLVHELEAMVPLAEDYDRRGVARPYATPDPRVADVIRDPDARMAWETGLGAARCYADLRTFLRRVLFRDFPCAHSCPRFQRFVAYHLNTPVSDVVTVYRFHTLVSEFGPYTRFAENFDRYALRPGFVGLMNMVRAEEVLVQHYKETPPAHRRNTVLIRYSRSKPGVLAFSALDVARRRISHRRNLHKDGTPIPIGIFVEQHYAGYDLLPMGISDAAAACTETRALVTKDTPYYYYVGPSEVLAAYKYVD